MKRLSVLLLVLFLSGCLSTQYASLINPDIDFSEYRTFYCLECLETIDFTKPRYDNEEIRRRIRDALQKELEDRGYIFQEEDPDLIIEFDFIIEDHIDTVAQRTTNYRYWKGLETDAYNYKMGTLIINMIDRELGQIVWQGSSESFLDLDPEKVEKKVGKVVKSIFKKYPYKRPQ